MTRPSDERENQSMAAEMKIPWPIALLAAAHLVVWDIAPWRDIEFAQPYWLTGVYYALYFVQLGLVSLWLPLGAADWKVRWTVGPLALAHVWTAGCTAVDGWEGATQTYTAAMHSSMVIVCATAMRVAGNRFVRRRTKRAECRGLPNQFSIRAILLATAAIAAWPGVYVLMLKQLDAMDDATDDYSTLVELWFAFSQTMIYGVGFLITSIIALRVKRLLLAAPLLVAAAPLPGYAAWHAMQPFTSDREILALFFQSAICETVIVLGSIAVIRAAGYRLVSNAEAAAEMEATKRLNCDVDVATVKT